jgi:hypothetical protein
MEFLNKQRRVVQQKPLEQHDITLHVLQFLKAPEQFKIAAVCKTFYKFSKDPRTFSFELKHWCHLSWMRETDPVPSEYARLGFIEEDFDSTEIQINVFDGDTSSAFH